MLLKEIISTLINNVFHKKINILVSEKNEEKFYQKDCELQEIVTQSGIKKIWKTLFSKS